MSERAVPYYCPYCGDQDLRPHEPEVGAEPRRGHWDCRACLRAFTLSMTGQLPRPETASAKPERAR